MLKELKIKDLQAALNVKNLQTLSVGSYAKNVDGLNVHVMHADVHMEKNMKIRMIYN